MTIYQSVTTKTGRFVRFNGVPILVLLVVILFVSALCHGQSVVGGSSIQAPTTNTYQMYSHPEHASEHAMASETSLLNSGGTTTAHGERPLWEFGSDKVEVPLGDVARLYRDMPRRKLSQIYWEQQGK